MIGLAMATAGILWADQRRYDFGRMAFRHEYWLSMTTNSADPQKARLTTYHRKMLAKYEWASPATPGCPSGPTLRNRGSGFEIPRRP